MVLSGGPRRRRAIVAGGIAGAATAVMSVAVASGHAETVGSCSFQTPGATTCEATGVVRHKPNTAVFVISESPSQAFKVFYRFTCFTVGGEAGYGRGTIAGTGKVTQSKRFPRGDFKKCEIDAAASLARGGSGSMKLTLKGR